MKEKKLSNNIIYSIVMQTAGVIAPLIISPYIARVLSAELIGDYSYTLANSSYFVLAECLGFSLYGTIKIAAVRDDKKELSRIFWEIFWIKIILMLICLSLYMLWISRYETGTTKALYYVMAINIISGGVDVTWFLNGIEEFRISALRTIFVRLINVVMIVTLVKSEKDLILYALIMQLSTLIGYVIVYPTLIKNVQWFKFNKLHFRQHVKASIVYFVPGLINTIFASTDKTILGAIGKKAYEVGVYEQANKICQLSMSMLNAVSNAILPRVTYLYSNKEAAKTRDFLKTSICGAALIAFPMTFGICAISNDFVPAFFGSGYDKSACLLKILCWNVLLVVLSNFIAQQCLIARGKQKEYNIAISISAILNVALNLLLVQKMQSIGVSIASVMASFVILLIIINYAKDMIDLKGILSISWHYFAASIIMYFIIFKINLHDHWTTIVVQVCIGAILYFVILVGFKDPIIRKVIKQNEKQ